MPDFFNKPGIGSGVMIATAVPSEDLLPRMSSPGDVDIFVIPYRKGYLQIERTLAIEVKIVRAKFKAQGKSPNQFGFSQAEGLLRHGFPFVAVAHLITSDGSPSTAWRPMSVVDMLDAKSGRTGGLRDFLVDMLPADLIERCYGRLLQRCSSARIGLLAAYVTEHGTWFPSGREAMKNPDVSSDTLKAIARYFRKNSWRFRDLPQFPRR